MLRSILGRVGILPAAALLAAISLTAQQSPPLERVSFFKVKAEKSSDFVTLARKHFEPLAERLIKEKTALGWGVDVWVNHPHDKDASTHSIWWAVPNYAALEKVLAAQAETFAKIQPAERQQWEQMHDPGAHHDMLFRALTGNFKTPPAGTLPYSRIVANRVQPGKGNEYRQIWEKYFKPVYERLLAEGAVVGYALEEEALNSMEPEWRWTHVALPDLAAMDKVTAAFDAEDARRTPAERSMMAGQLRDATVPGARRDILLRAVAFVPH